MESDVNTLPTQTSGGPHMVLITGMSGSGKSVALRTLEDAGYNCIDNLPLKLLEELVQLAQERGQQRLAIAIDGRSSGDIALLPGILHSIRQHGVEATLLFLDANDQTLMQRYSESRRRHPLSHRLTSNGVPPSLAHCIASERELLGSIRDLSHVIDTTDLLAAQLRSWIRQTIQLQNPPLVLTFQSFAFKQGVPSDSDMVFDVRCLPNPHYEPELRPLTGRDEPVARYLAADDQVKRMIDDIMSFIQTWLPHYTLDTRSYLTVSIGCTGGQHRSVYVVEQLAQLFKGYGPILVRHRAQRHFDLDTPTLAPQ